MSDFERYVAMTKTEWKIVRLVLNAPANDHDNIWRLLERLAAIRSAWYEAKLAGRKD